MTSVPKIPVHDDILELVGQICVGGVFKFSRFLQIAQSSTLNSNDMDNLKRGEESSATIGA